MEQQLNDFSTGLISLITAPFVAIVVLGFAALLFYMIRKGL